MQPCFSFRENVEQDRIQVCTQVCLGPREERRGYGGITSKCHPIQEKGYIESPVFSSRPLNLRRNVCVL